MTKPAASGAGDCRRQTSEAACRGLPRLCSLVLLFGCVSGSTSAQHTEAVQSHVYALPLDTVLTATTTVLVKKGWRVQRSGDQLGTNWRADPSGSASGYRVEGEAIDAEHCRIRVERLVATAFGPTSPSTPRGADFSGSGAWEGADAQSTLGDAPGGLVPLPRGRDEALEWALLQWMDSKAARAIAAADARSAPDAGPLPSPGTPASPAPVACKPEVNVLPQRRLILLGDVPGTREIPAFVGALACQAARTGTPTVVALELLREDQAWLDTYLASPGTPEDRSAFVRLTRSFSPAADSKGSTAVLDLLEQLRLLRNADLPLRVVAYDESAGGPARERRRATTLEHLRRSDADALFLVVVGRDQARTVLRPGETQDVAPLGWYLERWGLEPLALTPLSPGGQRWSCSAVPSAGCGPVLVNATGPEAAGAALSVKLSPVPDAEGFRGVYSVGPLSASPPPAL